MGLCHLGPAYTWHLRRHNFDLSLQGQTQSSLNLTPNDYANNIGKQALQFTPWSAIEAVGIALTHLSTHYINVPQVYFLGSLFV